MNHRPHRHDHRKAPEKLGDLTARLRRQSRKITGPRQLILEVLRRHGHPLTNREILAALPRGDCDLTTVYRSMHLLQELGMVKRFDFGDGVARFELIREGEDGHHHHLICQGCSKVVEVDECFPAEWERAIAAHHGFKAVRHTLEFFGLCPECQTA
jgi:Fur family ferric uptake transcriptional regulator